MYQIIKSQNECIKLQQKSFSELGFREREHLQEWFAKNPDMFGEDLLIIQKEFDGFSETRERLDLLALDKNGNLVIIENKLDDSGKDVTWQAIKYASYCSSLSKENIREMYQKYLDKSDSKEIADESLSDFFGKDYDEIILNKGNGQRIILVAAKFRKEVTSSVVWLMNYNISLKCIKVTPYTLNDQLFLDVNQIIPVKDIEDFTIRMTEKTLEEITTIAVSQSRHTIREKFWNYFLDYMNKKTDLFATISPKKDNYIGLGAGISGVTYNFVTTKSGARAEIYILTSSKDKNKSIYDFLYNNHETIDSKLNNYQIKWQRNDSVSASRVCIEVAGSYFDESSWEGMTRKLVATMIDFHAVVSPFVLKYKGSH